MNRRYRIQFDDSWSVRAYLCHQLGIMVGVQKANSIKKKPLKKDGIDADKALSSGYIIVSPYTRSRYVKGKGYKESEVFSSEIMDKIDELLDGTNAVLLYRPDTDKYNCPWE